MAVETAEDLAVWLLDENYLNPLEPELFFFFLISAHPVYKMWLIRESKKLALRNKLHFEEKKTESLEHV